MDMESNRSIIFSDLTPAPEHLLMPYNLMDAETGNLYDRFPSEEAALAFVRELIESNGVEVSDTLMLGGRDDAGRVLPVQTGAALVRRAQASPSDRPPLSRHAS